MSCGLLREICPGKGSLFAPETPPIVSGHDSFDVCGLGSGPKSHQRHVLIGSDRSERGEALPPTVREQFLDRFGVEIHEGYGLTETSPAAHISLPWASKLGTVGQALPEVETRIVDPSGTVVPAGQDGEVQLRGPNVMRGYHGMPEATAKVLDADGWFRTGDMGQLDADGYLSITGRIKEMLIVGGENVFPREIESVLEAHPDVEACGVIGRSDDKRGEVPVAFVELRDDSSLSPAELRSWAGERLAPYQCPREVLVVESLPRNPTGKVQRRELHALLP